ncbi:MAG: hypothetical protein HY052_07850 [Proteobacteria bacterium]|nr:hypothetical protein [Pseudomonadota bacterium]
MPIEDLYRAFSVLEEAGWVREEIVVSKRERDGVPLEFPIVSFRTIGKGSAVWILSGIHGEEPAGPNALAEGVDYIKKLGQETSVVLIPMCNPLGYMSNWRYLNAKTWTEGCEVHSVGDSGHVLPDLNNPMVPRAPKALSPESGALVKHVLRLAKDYPPVMSIDLHEDDLINEGYVYSQGSRNTIAMKIIDILAAKGVAIKMQGQTRFHERITNGIVSSTGDGSIDELLASERVIVGGKFVGGPHASVAIVVETPARAMSLAKRKDAHLEIIKNLNSFLRMET